jgi:ferredoxin
MDEVMKDGASGEYSVISYNEEGEPTQQFYLDKKQLIENGSATGAELVSLAGTNPPHETQYYDPNYECVRRENIVEKCIFCAHRLINNELPACVDACPSDARVIGDIDDASSDVAKLLKEHKSFVLQPDEGTSPNVYYIKEYSARK